MHDSFSVQPRGGEGAAKFRDPKMVFVGREFVKKAVFLANKVYKEM